MRSPAHWRIPIAPPCGGNDSELAETFNDMYLPKILVYNSCESEGDRKQAAPSKRQRVARVEKLK
jgi:hypothetical protein